ncbi:hypothetical protein H1C71_011984, partial [Ictidomys tridecemlineatus]
PLAPRTRNPPSSLWNPRTPYPNPPPAHPPSRREELLPSPWNSLNVSLLWSQACPSSLVLSPHPRPVSPNSRPPHTHTCPPTPDLSSHPDPRPQTYPLPDLCPHPGLLIPRPVH